MTINNVFSHIGEIIEFLRGKTIVETATVRYANGKEETERLGFSFLDYVSWSYSDRLKHSLADTKYLSEVEITARQLFEENESFVIRFRPESVYFARAQNIEDTLLLDLKRYLESNTIPYEVNTNGTN